MKASFCKIFYCSILCLAPSVNIIAQVPDEAVRKIADGIEPMYKHLHAHPELSLREEATSDYLAGHMESWGYDLVREIGGHGFAGILKRGEGQVVMIRADMDALPVQEQTGLEYASKAIVPNYAGREFPAMHACGHDMHMAIWLGTAKLLKDLSEKWQGTLIFLAQPAEEYGDGANKMLEDGLFEKIPVPDYAIALHVHATMEAGKVGYTPGYAYSNVDAMDIYVYGEGGHGAYPHATVDPIVLASRIVLALQTIASREISPLEPVVVTVGAFNGGTKHNVIPDEVHLQLTLRYHNQELREKIIASIRRICNGIAMSSGLPLEKYPKLEYYPENLPGVYNDPELTMKLAAVFKEALGEENVSKIEASMGGEDFGRYGTTEHGIPISIYKLGTIPAEKMEDYLSGDIDLPSLHSSKYAPCIHPTLETGIKTMSMAAMELLNRQ